MTTALAGIRACVFDAYGTLFDFASAAALCRDVLGDKTGPLTTLWRDKQIAYSWLRSLQHRYVEFSNVTADALDYAMRALAIEDPALRSRLLDLYRTLEPFPEVADVCSRACDKPACGPRSSPNGIARPCWRRWWSMPALAHCWTPCCRWTRSVFSRPDPGASTNWRVDRLGVGVGAMCFFSSNAWDAWAASAFGMRVVWCNRYGQPRENLPGRPDAEVRTLIEAVPLLLG